MKSEDSRLKLTVIYSSISFLIFIALSMGLYYLFASSINQSYLAEVDRRCELLNISASGNNENYTVASVAGQVAKEQVMRIILVLDTAMFIAFPLFGWFLTRQTLKPVTAALERQKQFVSDASHEMRTPLSIINGELELALKKDRPVADYKQVIKTVQEEIRHLTKLVESLLILARGSVNKNISFDHVDITDLINSVIMELEPKIVVKNLKIEFRPAETSSVVRGQTYLLGILFSNLVENAIKYSPDKSRIFIGIETVGNFIRTTIRDEGMGMSKTDLRKIFDRFYRSDISRVRTGGFGLGLSIADSIVRQHMGKIKVLSQLSRGSTFMVDLPRAAAG
jgi:two-component system, OmpR family, sensor histidine kinase CiaH